MSDGARVDGDRPQALALGPRVIWRQRELLSGTGMALLLASVAAGCVLWALHPLLMPSVLLLPVEALRWLTRARGDYADVRVEAGALVYAVGGEEVRIPRERIESAWRGPSPVTVLRPTQHLAPGDRPPESAATVVIRLRDRSVVRIGVRDAAEAGEILRALGRDPKTFRTSFQGRRVFHSLLFWMAGLPVAGAVTALLVRSLAAFSWAHSVSFALVLFTVVALALRAVMRPHLDVEVGTNGLLDRTRAFGRFLPWSEVAAVKLGDGALLFELRDGTRRRLWCNPEDGTVLPAVFARVTEALAAWQRSAQAGDPLTVLDRNGRTIAQWRADLATLLGGTGYREQVIDRARLEAVFADPATPLERRVGAALALAHDDPAATPTRVRVVAEGNAHPSERDLLLRLADGTADDDVLESALRAR